MAITLSFKNQCDTLSLGNTYTNTMEQLLKEDPDVVTLDADLMCAVGMERLARLFPERALNTGIQEANMVSMAAGFSRAGKKPYLHTFAAFAVRRTFDQLFISCGYGRNPIRLYGSDPGICAKYNGGTHMPFEDIGIMRTIPDSVIIDISDSTMFSFLLRATKDLPNLVYFRADRSPAKRIYAPDSTFEIGKGALLRDGTDVTIIAAGILVPDALTAAETLQKRGISAAVIDMYSIKPLDRELILTYASKTKAIVTAENHNENGGLGDAVASALCGHCPVPMEKLAVNDYGEVGPFEYLKERYHLDEAGIIGKVETVLKRK